MNISEVVDKWDRHHQADDQFMRPFVAAARAVVEAPEILWCETHDSEGQTPDKAGTGYVPGLCFGAIGGPNWDKPCRFVVCRLVEWENTDG